MASNSKNNLSSSFEKTNLNKFLGQGSSKNQEQQGFPVQLSVIASGKALELILDNEYLREHFLFLTVFSESIVCYESSGSIKGKLVELVNNMKHDSVFTLAIGDGLNDLQMLSKADYSIQIDHWKQLSKHDDKTEISKESADKYISLIVMNASDASVRSLKGVAELLFSRSCYSAELHEETILFTFYRSTFICLVAFFWNFIGGVYGEMIFSLEGIISINVVSYLMQVFLYFYRKEGKAYKNKFNLWVLVEQFNNKKVFQGDILSKFLFQIIPQALSDAIILFVHIYSLHDICGVDSGKIMEESDLHKWTLQMFYFLSHLKVIIILNQSKFTLLANVLIPLCFTIFFAIIGYYQDHQNFVLQFQLPSFVTFLGLFANFILLSFIIRTFSPLIKQPLMRNTGRFTRIFMGVLGQYHFLLSEILEGIQHSQKQLSLADHGVQALPSSDQQSPQESQQNSNNLANSGNASLKSDPSKLASPNSPKYPELTLKSPQNTSKFQQQQLIRPQESPLLIPSQLLEDTPNTSSIDHSRITAKHGLVLEQTSDPVEELQKSSLNNSEPNPSSPSEPQNKNFFGINYSEALMDQISLQSNMPIHLYSFNQAETLGEKADQGGRNSPEQKVQLKLQLQENNNNNNNNQRDFITNVQSILQKQPTNLLNNGSSLNSQSQQLLNQTSSEIGIYQENQIFFNKTINGKQQNEDNQKDPLSSKDSNPKGVLSMEYQRNNSSNKQDSPSVERRQTKVQMNLAHQFTRLSSYYLLMFNKFFSLQTGFRGITISEAFKLCFKNGEVDSSLQELSREEQGAASSVIDRLSLKFSSHEIESKFEANARLQWRYQRIASLVQSVVLEFSLVLIIGIHKQDTYALNLYSSAFIIQLILWGFSFTKYSIQHMQGMITSQQVLRAIARIMYLIAGNSIGIDEALITVFYCGLTQYSMLLHPITIGFLLISPTFILCLRLLYDQNIIQHAAIYQFFCISMSLISINILTFVSKYQYDLQYRLNFQRVNRISLETRKINNVLAILLPKFILDNINLKGRHFQEDQGVVAILFCDIADFDLIIQEEHANILKLLDKLFRIYDSACAVNGLQKIETVGKTYMAAGGLKGIKEGELKKTKQNKNFHPVIKCILMAQQIMEASAKITYGKKQEKLKIKIGIHYGEVLAGVIGGHKPQFSLIGDTVNMASRVCSTGETNFTTISDEAKQSCSSELERLNETKFRYESEFIIHLLEKNVNAKGKGMIKTHQVAFKKLQHKQIIHQANRNQDKKPLPSPFSLEIQPTVIAESPLFPPSNNEANSLFSSQLSSPKKRSSKFSNPNNSISHSTENIHENSPKMASKFERPSSPSKKKQTLIIQANAYRVPLKKASMVQHQPGKDLQDICEVHSNSMTSNLESKQDSNLRGGGVAGQLNELAQELGMMPFIEQPCPLRDTEMNYERIICHFQDMKIEQTSHFNQENKKTDINFSIRDLLTGKLNEDLNMFYEQEFRKSSKQIKRKSAFLCVSEVFKMLVVNLLQKYLGATGVQITLVLHLISVLLLLSSIFFLKSLSRRGLMLNKLVILLCYSFSLLSLTVETQLIILQQLLVENLFFISILFGHCVLQLLFSFQFFNLKEKSIIASSCIVVHSIFGLLNGLLALESFFFSVILQVHYLYRSYQELEINFSAFLSTRNLDSKMNEQHRLLEYLLPNHIRDQFLQNDQKQINLADNFESVTILYADIAGFTKYSASVKPEQVFFMLSELFTKFDQKCQEYEAYKLYTIGDCYVVMGLLNVKDRNIVKEAMNVIHLGLEMIEIIKQVRSIVNFEELEMRIGIHTGSIIGGVVGTGVVRYDIYGPDVVIANKMESNGESGRVMISEATLNLILESSQGVFEFERELEVYVAAAKSTVKAYLVISLDDDNEKEEDQEEEDSQESQGQEEQKQIENSPYPLSLNMNNNEINNNQEQDVAQEDS